MRFAAPCRRNILPWAGRGRLRVVLFCCLTFWSGVDSFVLLQAAPASCTSPAQQDDDDDDMIEPAGLREAARQAPGRKAGPAALALSVGVGLPPRPCPLALPQPLIRLSPPGSRPGFAGPLRC
jgi:hypothetical protein